MAKSQIQLLINTVTTRLHKNDDKKQAWEHAKLAVKMGETKKDCRALNQINNLIDQ